ncbi:diacylglycerol/lipid kinase family protein [Pseudoroseomonas globiformis]|uniref:Diacylglycerol/lipid kinase family protein n=1 Tax=Teichococcus globiformis TaxID=2307229 RepID=A0ABV7FZ56_9PROT
MPVRVKVIINAGGGSVQGQDRTAEIALAFAQHGIEATVSEVEGEGLIAATRAAAEQDWDAVIAGGGDGTLGTVAGILAGTGKSFGVLPLGTRNHFARDLGVPLEVEGAVAVIAAGHIRRIDLAEVNGRVFINNSTVGLYADMVTERERQQKRRGWRKTPAMLLASARILTRFARHRLAVRAEGWGERLKTPLVFVGNNLYETTLPHAGRRTCIDRGELCLCITRHGSRLGILRMLFRAVTGRLKQERDFEMRAVREAEIRSPRRLLRVSMDGEVVTMQAPLRYRTRPGALAVFAPSEAPR